MSPDFSGRVLYGQKTGQEQKSVASQLPQLLSQTADREGTYLRRVYTTRPEVKIHVQMEVFCQ